MINQSFFLPQAATDHVISPVVPKQPRIVSGNINCCIFACGADLTMKPLPLPFSRKHLPRTPFVQQFQIPQGTRITTTMPKRTPR